MSEPQPVTLFEDAFKRYSKNLSGSEVEIVAYKTIARQWFDLGLHEGALIMDRAVHSAVRDVRELMLPEDR